MLVVETAEILTRLAILTMKTFPMALEDLVVPVAPADPVATDSIASKDLAAADETHQPREPVP
jgi:hypothetical protein